MAIITVQLIFNEINASLQIGDEIYYTKPSPVSGGFENASLADTIFLGQVTSFLTPSVISVQYNDNTTSPPAIGDFISFSKNKKVNRSKLKGYYAEVKMVNNSTKKAELFSLSSEVSESSK